MTLVRSRVRHSSWTPPLTPPIPISTLSPPTTTTSITLASAVVTTAYAAAAATHSRRSSTAAASVGGTSTTRQTAAATRRRFSTHSGNMSPSNVGGLGLVAEDAHVGKQAPEPLTLAGIRARRAKAGKLDAPTASYSDSDMFKAPVSDDVPSLADISGRLVIYTSLHFHYSNHQTSPRQNDGTVSCLSIFPFLTEAWS